MVVLLVLFALVMTGLGIAVWGVSAAANYSFGLTQGTTEPFIVDLVFGTVSTSTAHIMALVNLAVDGLKALLPFGAIVCWRFGCYAWSVVAAMLFVGCLSWSGTNSMGFTATEGMKARDGRASGGLSYDVLRSRLEGLQAERGMVPEFRPAGTIEAEISRTKANALFARAKGCSDVSLPASRTLCHNYGAALGELAAARRAEELNDKIDQVRTEMLRERRVTSADPLAGSVAGWLGVSEKAVETGRNMHFSLLIELISAFIFTLAWTPLLALVMKNREARQRLLPIVAQPFAIGDSHALHSAPSPAPLPAPQAEPIAAAGRVATGGELVAGCPADEARPPVVRRRTAAAAPPVNLFPLAARAQAPDPRFARRPDPFPITQLAGRAQFASEGAVVSGTGTRLGRKRFNSPAAAAEEFVPTLTPGFHAHKTVLNQFKAFCRAHKCKSGNPTAFSKLMEANGVKKLAYPDHRVLYLVGEVGEAAGESLQKVAA